MFCVVSYNCYCLGFFLLVVLNCLMVMLNVVFVFVSVLSFIGYFFIFGCKFFSFGFLMLLKIIVV